MLNSAHPHQNTSDVPRKHPRDFCAEWPANRFAYPFIKTRILKVQPKTNLLNLLIILGANSRHLGNI